MAVVDVVALVIGARHRRRGRPVLAAASRRSPDQSMRWEAGVAVGFTALIVLGPFWVAQLVLTIIATRSEGGLAAGWLWAWLFVAPLAAVTWGGRAR